MKLILVHLYFQVNTHFSCQAVPSQVTVATQTDDIGILKPHYRSPSLELNTSFDDKNTDNQSEDPDWVLSDSDIENGTDQEDIPANKERKFLVFEKQLDKLMITDCLYCGQRKNVIKTIVGTGLIADISCQCKAPSRWYSQPMSGTMPLGNIVLAGGIMFSGASLTTTLNVFRHAGIQCFSDRTYSSIQYGYLVPVIRSVWNFKQTVLIDEIKENDSGKVKLGGDARCCSPGHTAKYGSYSVMNLKNNTVLDIQLVQVCIYVKAVYEINAFSTRS